MSPLLSTRGNSGVLAFGLSNYTPSAPPTVNWFSSYLRTLNDVNDDPGSPELISGIVCNTDGDIYVAGHYRRSFTDGLVTLQVSKFNKYGTLQWQKLVGRANIANTYTNYSSALDIDSAGNIYVSIYQDDYIGMSVIKLNSAGEIQWQKRETSSYNTENGGIGRAVAISSSGDVYTTGSGSTIVLAYKMNSSGVLQWGSGTLTSNVTNAEGRSLDTDSSGNLYVGGTITISNASYGYLVKYNSSGAVQWQRRVGSAGGGAEPTAIKKVVVDSSDNIYVTGYFENSMYMVLLKYNPSGTLLWARRYGSLTNASETLTVDSAGNIYLLGYGTESGLNYGLIAKYDTNGTLVWGRRFKSNADIGQPVPCVIQIDEANENIIIASNLYYPQHSGFYILKVPTSGDKTGTYTISGLDSSIIYSASAKTSATLSIASTAVTYTYANITPLTSENVTSYIYTSNTTTQKVNF